MIEPIIIDNFLPEQIFIDISKEILTNHFPWYFSEEVSSEEDLKNANIFQFFHVFYTNNSWVSQYSPLIFPLVETLKVSALIRIKSNLLTITPTPTQHQFHTDVDNLRSKTAVYYINTNNGKTIFKSGLEVESIANRILIFNSHELHTSSSCSDNSRRIVINLNFYDD